MVVFCRANVMGKDLFSYVDTKAQYATDKNLKKANFKEAIDQIEKALSGEDPAPTEVMSMDWQRFCSLDPLEVELNYLFFICSCQALGTRRFNRRSTKRRIRSIPPLTNQSWTIPPLTSQSWTIPPPKQMATKRTMTSMTASAPAKSRRAPRRTNRNWRRNPPHRKNCNRSMITASPHHHV